MTNINKYIVLPLLGFAIIGIGAYGLSKVDAAETNPLPPMMQGVAERFGINEDDLHSYMEDQMDKRHEEMQQTREDRLNELVEAGTITAEQKNMLDEKHEEMEAMREEYRNLEPQERREKMHELRDEMHQWAEDNGIDLPHNNGGEGMHMGNSFGRKGVRANMHGDTPTTE